MIPALEVQSGAYWNCAYPTSNRFWIPSALVYFNLLNFVLDLIVWIFLNSLLMFITVLKYFTLFCYFYYNPQNNVFIFTMYWMFISRKVFHYHIITFIRIIRFFKEIDNQKQGMSLRLHTCLQIVQTK